MTRLSGWNAQHALAALRARPWRGRAWRFHRRRYEALDGSGSLLASGRYHRGADQFPAEAVHAALYLALGPEIALGEMFRHFAGIAPRLNEYRLTELEVTLGAVLDCRNAKSLGLAAGDLVDDYDFTIPQALAAAAITCGAEGILVSSATGLGDNLVVFPGQVGEGSELQVVGSRDPRLYVPR